MFQLPAEKAHHLTMQLFDTALAVPGVGTGMRVAYTLKDQRLRKKVFGLDFPNPVGLAAGFDKDGKYYQAMANLGFGFIELGTVTPRPQAGNPQPRLFRIPQDRALINRMGFNNDGVGALVDRLVKGGRPQDVILGGNIGKNKDTPNEKAVDDYTYCFERLFDHVDYFVVNVSSPNTPGLRALQDKEPLTRLLAHLQSLNQQQSTPKPLLLKIAPDLNEGQLDDIIQIAKDTALSGIIATNTTIARAPLSITQNEIDSIGNGGLSGMPVRQRSTEVIRYLHERSEEKLIIVGVGGIDSPQAALEKLEAGASLIQVYSGLVYAGPTLIKKINQAILKTV